MKVRDVMTPNVACITQETTIQETAQMMTKLNVGSMPVCEQESIVGIVTDRDILIRSVAEPELAVTSSIGSIMTPKVKTISIDTNVEEAVRIMGEHQIRRLPVTENNAVVGMVALSDIAVNTDLNEEISKGLYKLSNPHVKI